jgi:hypothetical protein
MLAEHGMFGVSALMLLLCAAAVNVRRVAEPRTRAVVAALTAWALIFMFDKAMRTSAPGLLLGLGFASFAPAVVTTQRVAQSSRRLLSRMRPARRLFVGRSDHAPPVAGAAR